MFGLVARIFLAAHRGIDHEVGAHLVRIVDLKRVVILRYLTEAWQHFRNIGNEKFESDCVDMRGILTSRFYQLKLFKNSALPRSPKAGPAELGNLLLRC